MTDRSERESEPLPREWLPEAVEPEGAAVWEFRTKRILAAAEPTLLRLARDGDAGASGGLVLLGSWWKPAAGLAAAAAAAWIILLAGPANVDDADTEWVYLSVVSAAGEPAALWEGLGIEADPVLAAMVLQEPEQE